MSRPPIRASRGRSGAPTLEDVAAAAGVSLATASRVINGSTRRVAESYRERVTSAARALGYTANLSAQATVRGTTSIVGLLVADIADPYFGRVAAGVVEAADAENLVVTIAMTGRDEVREARLLQTFRGQRPRGLIVAASRTETSATGPAAEALDALVAAGTRVVSLGRSPGPASTIEMGNREGGRILGRTLAQLGYRRAIALVAEDGVYTSDDRLRGFREGFEPIGHLERLYRCGFTSEEAEAATVQALRDGIAPGTLVMCVSDIVAIAAMSTLRRAGREVGADVAVSGFDDLRIARDVSPELTTVQLQLEQLGHAAVRAVLDSPDAVDSHPAPRVIQRGTTPSRSSR